MAFEISRFVAIHSMAKDQILCSCGRADGIRLDKTHALDGGFQRAGMKERMRNGESAQLLKVWHKTGTIKSTRAIRAGNVGPLLRTPCYSDASSIGEESACYRQRGSRLLARQSRASE
jgi:hypothetical protein